MPASRAFQAALQQGSRVYVSEHRGLVGSAIMRARHGSSITNVVTRTSKELDLRNQQAVADFFTAEQSEYVILAAARVGGHSCQQHLPRRLHSRQPANADQCHRLCQEERRQEAPFWGSSCIYPRLFPQTIKEEYLLTGPLEPTNEWYALVKIASIKMCQAYRTQYGFDAISTMPTNLYGTGDNYHPENSHVIPALIHRFHEAKQAGKAKLPFGAQVHRALNFFLWKTMQKPWYSSCTTIQGTTT